ncbi:hypothetical protein [Sphingobium sp.]|uniref:hypothetical protein n=1 Tax=Sphingobium sp. TaxID=1912891 RepID=UPI002D7EBA13|nr:hypothetical protein [Sphingobium sp.]
MLLPHCLPENRFIDPVHPWSEKIASACHERPIRKSQPLSSADGSGIAVFVNLLRPDVMEAI